MRPRLSVSRSAVELIKAFEGFRAKAAQLDDGRWTIGYGHTLTAREGAEVTEPDAEALLLYDLIGASHAVNEHGLRAADPEPVRRAGVVRLQHRRPRASAARRPCAGSTKAGRSKRRWRWSCGARPTSKASGSSSTPWCAAAPPKRRCSCRPMEGWMPAPTPVLPPKLDYDALGMIPLTSPVATRTATVGRPPLRRAHARGRPAAGAARRTVRQRGGRRRGDRAAGVDPFRTHHRPGDRGDAAGVVRQRPSSRWR